MAETGILGTGVDLVENDRMSEMLNRWGKTFKDRVFLETEQAYCDARPMPHFHYAGRFAVKEAVSKAFGTGIGPQLGLRDIEVVRDEDGPPRIRLHGKGASLANERGVDKIHVTLSHTRSHAVAFAILTAA